MTSFIFYVILLSIRLSITTTVKHQSKPNIVLIISDDQDVVLNGMEPMVKTKQLIGDVGSTFLNAFVTTPICCVSRASILTGKYAHNHRVRNNSIDGNCASQTWIRHQEPFSIAAILEDYGYTNFYAGKYLNQYGHEPEGWRHVPKGWHTWYGLLGNSVYYNYSLSINGTKLESHLDADEDYLTNILVEKFLNFMTTIEDRPFFAILSPPAPHSPFSPYKTYRSNFSREMTPRTKSFNVYGSDKHWLLRQAPRTLDQSLINYIDEVYRNRWRTLLSVDDLVESVINETQRRGVYDRTYFIYTSDNGYHMGQFCLPFDKRQLYEFDIRVPLLISGPGVLKRYLDQIVLNIDLAPLILDMANVSDKRRATAMDGRSYFHLLRGDERRGSKWRKNFLIEYWGEANRGVSSQCPNEKNVAECHPQEECICQDAVNNTYVCVRQMNARNNLVFCRFDDKERFVEAYDLDTDPAQLTNLHAFTFQPTVRRHWDRKLYRLKNCVADSCA